MRTGACVLATALVAGAGACGSEGGGGAAPAGTAPPPAAPDAAAARPGRLVLPPPRLFDPNPLRLAPGPGRAAARGARVFAVPRRMLDGAQLGSTLALRLATVEGVDADKLVVSSRSENAYPIHRRYVVVPAEGRLQGGMPVLASYRGALGHGVLAGLHRDWAKVRFVDLGHELPEQKLPRNEVAPLPEGLEPGGFAVWRDEQGWHHGLLVSAGSDSEALRSWLVLGQAGAAELVEEHRLRPVAWRYRPRSGAEVWVAWRGVESAQ
ncbi:MAG: hypothetical protein HY744_18690 [Deltaproteobacteria bacterium]|nr:hypothetical protein [Deltaproteobacteria bacterium]